MKTAPTETGVRVPEYRYVDPLDQIWLFTASKIGLTITRTSDVYAHSDGEGNLYIGTPETLDPDDCLAQMIFHELCHAMVQGPSSIARGDWGIDNTNKSQVVLEHACLRLQATLAGRWGLRGFLAPTTTFRSYYDALEGDPLSPEGGEASALAARGLENSAGAPFHPHVERALEATKTIVGCAKAMSSEPEGELPSLYRAAL